MHATQDLEAELVLWLPDGVAEGTISMAWTLSSIRSSNKGSGVTQGSLSGVEWRESIGLQWPLPQPIVLVASRHLLPLAEAGNTAAL